MPDKKEILFPIKEILSQVFGARLYGIILFGSELRDESRSDSDIDILLLLNDVDDPGKDLRTALDSLADLSSRWERRISIKPVSILDYQNGDCPLLRQVKKEGIIA